jgi:O-antigen biosynthesis protein
MLRKVEKIFLTLKKRGLIGGFKELASRFFGIQKQNTGHQTTDLKFLMLPRVETSLLSPKSNQITINWLIPDFGKGSGGHINIFRFVLLFEKMGFNQKIYVFGDLVENPELIRSFARQMYFPLNSSFEILSNLPSVRDADILITTSWESAYYGRSIGNVRQRYYMVQDREDMFFPAGSLAEFARATYQFGFVGLTAGKWLADSLKSQYGMECFPFSFSYDRHLYTHEQSEIHPKMMQRVFFYARPTTERRGFELGMLVLELVSKVLPMVEFVLAGTSKKDWDVPFNVVHVGVLRLEQLSSLYRSCDVALVLSHTNLSLLPLELMASGCPVVSNRGPNVEWLLNEQNCVLADPEPQALANAIVDLLNDPERLHTLRLKGIELAETTSWELEAQRLASILKSRLGIHS